MDTHIELALDETEVANLHDNFEKHLRGPAVLAEANGEGDAS